MKQITLILALFACTLITAIAQEKSSFEIDFTNPKSVVEAIFYAAKTKDFAILQCLCDPYEEGDGDVKEICSVSTLANKANADGKNENIEKSLDQFARVFGPGRINGEVTYEKFRGTPYANVPFHFNHPGGESRSNESMKLVKRYGNWYLSSF